MCSSPESPTEYNFREIRPSDKGFRIYWTILNDGNSKYESKDQNVHTIRIWRELVFCYYKRRVQKVKLLILTNRLINIEF